MGHIELAKLKAVLPPNMTLHGVNSERTRIYNEHDEHTIDISHEVDAGGAITRLIEHYATAGRNAMRQEIQRDYMRLMGIEERITEAAHAAMR